MEATFAMRTVWPATRPQCIIRTQISGISDITRTSAGLLRCERVGLPVERAHAVGVIGGSLRPNVVARQVDVIPRAQGASVFVD